MKHEDGRTDIIHILQALRTKYTKPHYKSPSVLPISTHSYSIHLVTTDKTTHNPITPIMCARMCLTKFIIKSINNKIILYVLTSENTAIRYRTPPK